MVGLLSTMLMTLATTAVAQMGGWSPVTDPSVQTALTAIVSDPANYANVTTRLCATDVAWATQQVVAGVQYHVGVHGCKTTATSNCSCDGQRHAYLVTVLEAINEPVRITAVVATDETTGLVGGVSAPVPATADDKLLYVRAVTKDANFASASVPRVCPVEFVSVAKQVVSGIKHIFIVRGCALVPTAPLNNVFDCACEAPKTYRVEIYEDAARHIQDVWSTLRAVTAPLGVVLPTTLSGYLYSTPKTASNMHRAAFRYLWPVLRACVWFNVWRVRNDRVFRADLPLPSPWTIAVKAARVAQMHLHHSLVHNPGKMALRRLLRLLAQHEWPRQHLVPRIALLPPPA
ncbi:hypothetical protein SDRG_09679 [Saprolegnia diclina VS20]|uniref:Cystatin domain-containing protein n=1 Tax=Saprolegnia diclina (strain VS20) TaxID=1156394 RepID=T0QD83_SAPDV|nr:hypothetical protein SDRG_09679 [Saprolegnia diclina VS20]EQC32706.1 hypothetical protein SDRG_09679 [Saprolegnia diclina VS20]|eukprot:XP_008613850.1 hypothetical protein SDRG_09679 [Saprolegnia diclina VS20]